jgi:hypothetical protein
MAKQDKELTGQFWAILAAHKPADMSMSRLLDIGNRLVDIAKSQERYNVQACNVGLTDRQQARSDKIDAEAVELGKELGAVKVTCNGDPRGYPLFLDWGDGTGNDGWGHRGLIVPLG